jgi:hypothetical protein
MTITTPSTFEVVTQQALATAALTKEPLHTIARRLNYLWRRHRPAHVAVSPTTETMTRDTIVEVGVDPSVDGLLYAFTHRARILTTGTMAITVEAWDGASWATIYGPSSTATTGSTWFEHAHSTTIAAGTRRLRVTYAHGTDTYWVSDLHAVPAPTTTPSTPQTSGFAAYDDGQLAATGAPIHAELLNRCKASAVAVLQDRKHCVLSFAQDRTTPRFAGQVTQSPGSLFTGSPYQLLGRGRCELPGNLGAAVLTLHVHGKTTGGGTTATLTIRQVGATHADSSATFDLDDTWQQSSSIVVVGERPELELLVVNPDTSGTNKAIVDSVVALWSPGVRP